MHVAFAHWAGGKTDATTGEEGQGVLEYCSTVSGAGLKSFMQAWPYTNSPEPTAM